MPRASARLRQRLIVNDSYTMDNLIALIGLAAAAFAATNLDDIFLLMAFFAGGVYSARQVVAGQVVGIGALVALSLAGALAALVIPAQVVALMGLLPILIGARQLWGLRGAAAEETEIQAVAQGGRSGMLRFLAVSGVTIANGGDNIGVYIPLFASHSAPAIGVMVMTFAVMTGVWCALGFYLVHHSVLSGRIQRHGHQVLPLVLIGLGVYILAEGFL